MSKIQYEKYIVSSDETGYGSLIANLIVCGVRAECNWSLKGLNDSKKMTELRREQLREKLLKEADKGNIVYYMATRTHTQIDALGVYNVLKDAHIETIKALYQPTDHIIVDGNLKFDGLGVDNFFIQSIIKADTKIPQCMAASILAKTTRDAQIKELSKQFPQYGWENNKGYYNSIHIKALNDFGPTPMHRKSYEPVKSILLRAKGKINE